MSDPRVLDMELVHPGLASFYTEAAPNHAGDSGFDLYFPEDVEIPAGALGFAVDLGVRCAPHFDSGYFLYCRSSISKTPIRLANAVGIIDNGYRGTIQVRVDNRGTEAYTVKKGERLFQLCMPSLKRFVVRVVDSVAVDTDRGAGGFGSTGSA